MAFECLRKTVPVGGKNDPVCPNTILLLKDKPLTFGRVISTETNVRLLSKQTPLMVSRKHATVAYSAGEWTIVDHESLNGVFINGRKIPVNSPEPLSIGDKITLGVAVNSGHPEFEYVLESMSKPKKRQAEPSTASEAIPNKQRKVLSESDRSNVHRETPSCSHDEKIKAAEQKIKILNNNLEEKEKVYEKVLEELKRKESVMESELLRQKASLENEKEDLERSLKELLEKSPKEKEEMLSEELETQKELLIKEKHKVEEKLQNELNQKLELKDKELEEKLLAQKADLEKVIAEKEAQQKELQQELSIHKSATEKLKDLEENEKRLVTSVQELQSLMEKKDRELLKQMEVTKKAEEEARKSVVEEMEDEFSCIVCQELFIRATTLTCSHSFCEYCLQSWLRKRNTCPICRCAVQSQPVRSIVLDNAIAKMVDSMDVASKERRRAVMEERAEKSRELAQSSGSQRTPIVLNEEPERRHVRVNNEVDVWVEPRRIHNSYLRGNNSRHNEVYERVTHYHDYRNQYSHRPPAYGNRYTGLCFHCGMRGHWARSCPYRR
ncbi:E3 ubiquitin-protein ligase rnf8 [Nematostella vectensis]|uniref:E3 ubiquitin-protein ligase rnf8 n=1 Tax=Nematostella vectensis TaxID=45351 RepID=UPI00207725B7|nr:E3 ubiquitin-protein ligase rnf8 [Nematostella vectensis]